MYYYIWNKTQMPSQILAPPRMPLPLLGPFSVHSLSTMAWAPDHRLAEATGFVLDLHVGDPAAQNIPPLALCTAGSSSFGQEPEGAVGHRSKVWAQRWPALASLCCCSFQQGDGDVNNNTTRQAAVGLQRISTEKRLQTVPSTQKICNNNTYQ